MRKFSLVAILLLNTFAFGQVEFKGVMGIYFFSSPSMQNYVNQLNFVSLDNELGSFNTAVIFAGEVGVFLNRKYLAATEMGYQIFSQTITGDFGKYELTWSNLMPTFMIYNVILGEGYNFKFGGGGGIRFTSVDVTIPAQEGSTNYTSTGYGFVARVEGNTLLGGNAYANIGFDIRYDVNGEPENAKGEKLVNTSQNELVNFNALSFGVRLGITYIIGGND